MIITSNGRYKLQNLPHYSETVIYTKNFNGATVNIVDGDLVIEDGILSEDSQTIITHGEACELEILVDGFENEFEIKTAGIK